MKSNKFSRELIDWFKSLLIALVIALLIRHFVIEVFLVEGGSMHPNLYNGERVVVNKFIYNFSNPERDEVIVFNYSEDKDFIKRIIGLPGEKVRIEDGDIFINGDEHEGNYPTLDDEIEDFGPKEVEEDSYFVLGDNRENSKDSRSFGAILEEDIEGRASFVFWPPGEIRWVR